MVTTAESIPISIYPRTAWGRAIGEAYWFSFISGHAFTLCFGALLFVAFQKGFRRDWGTILQYCTHLSSSLSIAMSYSNLLQPYGCGPHPFTAYTYSLAEIACDGYILIIVLALIEPGRYQKIIRYGWLGFFFIAEIGSRILQYAYITYVPILIICRTTVDPTISNISTGLKTAFIIAMGLSLTYTLIRSKSAIVSSVGLKSVIACIILIASKIALFVPFSIFGLTQLS
jgi:hypothetical protein